MIPGDNPNQVIAGVLDTLRQSRAMLLDPSPRNIDSCRVAVAGCIARVSRLAETDRANWNSPALRDSLQLMQRELNGITALLDSAARFRRDMLKTISEATPSPVISIDAGSDKVRHVHVLG